MKQYDDLDKAMNQYISYLIRRLEELDDNSLIDTKVDNVLFVDESEVVDAKSSEIKESKKKPNKLMRWISDILFYGGLVFALVTLFFTVQDKKQGVSVLGYTPLYIETSSMESVMPRGSLIFIKQMDTSNLIVGDDITFIADNKGKTITHRIINIYPDFEGEGLTFETKGVDNPEADKDKVLEANVLGKVTLVLPEAGIYLTFVKDNMVLMIMLMVLASSALYMFKSYLSMETPKEDGDEA